MGLQSLEYGSAKIKKKKKTHTHTHTEMKLIARMDDRIIVTKRFVSV
jgi:hypothetical protein